MQDEYQRARISIVPYEHFDIFRADDSASAIRNSPVSLLQSGPIIVPECLSDRVQSRYSCLTQSTSITHSPDIGESVIFA